MKTLSSQDITQISGGFSAENLLSSAEIGAILGLASYAVLLPIGPAPFIPCLAIPVAGFVGLSLLHEAAASFDRHYGYKF